MTFPIASHLHPGAHLLKELDFTTERWRDLVDLAAALKAARREGREEQWLAGRTIALVFAKTSTRTRAAFAVAAAHQGAATVTFDPGSSQFGRKESVADTARVLGRMFDGIEFRGEAQADVETFARLSGVPVWNGLTDEWHPTQVLADALTMREHAPGRAWGDVAYAYVGDARFNMGRSLLVSGAILGQDVRIVAPRALCPPREVIDAATARARTSGGRVTVSEDVGAVAGTDFVLTDVWVSMGEPEDAWESRIRELSPYRVTERLMGLAGPRALFMHCLPAYHDLGTQVGRRVHERFGLDSIEVTDEVFEGPRSIVFDEAENRLHTIKAVMVNSLGREPKN